MIAEPAPADAWQAWTPWELAARLRDVDVTWCVVGGWSIDLFVGDVTRDHHDLEFTVLRSDFATARAAFAEMEAFTTHDGELRHLPREAEAPAPDVSFQTWMLDPNERVYRVDMMLEPGDATTWVYRRDETLTAPRDFMVSRTADGIPYLAPHGSLLFKAKYDRAKDEHDFSACAPRLASAARAWLAEAIERFHPGHAWIDRLREA